MLTALNDEGKRVSLVNVSRSHLHEKLSSRFYCPVCKESLILKLGEIRIPHFAHRRTSNCSNFSTEPESPRHLLGKKHLYQFYQRKGYTVYLEYFLSEIQQRPDLLIKKDEKTFAVEYQCSPLSRRRLEERNSGYRKLGIIPIWILGTTPYKRRVNQLFELTDFQLSMCRHDKNSTLTLLSYLPEDKTFLQLVNMLSVTSTRIFGQLQIFSILDDQKPSPHLNNNTYEITTWQKEKKIWLQNKVYYGNLHNDLFLKEIYTAGHNPFLLPGICGIPTPYAHLIHEHPVVWQFYVYLDCLQGLPIGQKISLRWVKQKLSPRFKLGFLTIREFPLDFNKLYGWELAIKEYFVQLTALEYLSQIGEDLFLIEKSISIPKNVEGAIKQESEIFQKGLVLTKH